MIYDAWRATSAWRGYGEDTKHHKEKSFQECHAEALCASA